jgi:hypothetical protein
VEGKNIMPNYEVAIFNQEVREAIARKERHESFDDDWGTTQYIEVVALNEEMARAKVAKKHPENLGFVIEEVFEA